jgi:hypothetical protein
MRWPAVGPWQHPLSTGYSELTPLPPFAQPVGASILAGDPSAQWTLLSPHCAHSVNGRIDPRSAAG